MAIRGEDYELRAAISIEQAYQGTLLELNLSMPEYDAAGRLQRVPCSIKARVPKGATSGQRLRLPGKGGRGFNGGPDGDLYLDLPLAPWEAALGAAVEVPTPGGVVQLKVPPGTAAGQSLRLGGRGLPRPKQGSGDLYAIARIVMPPALSTRARELLAELATATDFAPRAEMLRENGHGN